MIQSYVKYLVIFIILLILQVTVIDNIYLFNLFHPWLYLWILIMLPYRIPKWALLITAFLVGLLIDLFSYTPGMHASASVFIGFIRPFFLKIISSKEEIKETSAPHIGTLGTGNYFIYLLILTFLHHFVLLFVEVFGFHEWERTLLRVVINTGITATLIFIGELIFFYRTEGD